MNPPDQKASTTFLFTDIEGSTRLIQRLGEDYTQLLEDHHEIMRESIRLGGGAVVNIMGDGFFASFETAEAALEAAITAQRKLSAHPWPRGLTLLVRMGIHTGSVSSSKAGYISLDIHLAARICAACHGGQVLLSAATRAALREGLAQSAYLTSLGHFHLKDIVEPEALFQLNAPGLIPDFPPPRTLGVHRHNLPHDATEFVGRIREKKKPSSSSPIRAC